MSTGLPVTAQIEFDSMVKAAYQSMGKLRKHVRVKPGVTGNTARFRVASRGVATPRIPQTDLVPMGASYTSVDAVLTDWNAAEYTDVFDQQKTNIDEQKIVAQNIAGAIDRRIDQMIINALDAANAAQAIVNGGTGFTYAKLLRIGSLMDQRAVPAGQRKLAISARAKEDLLNDSNRLFISRDFVNQHVIQTGTLPQILGFDIEVIDNRDEGGLPLSGITRTNFAWDAQAIGLAIGIEPRTTVDWIPEKTSWLANRILTAGAIAIDPLAVIEVEAQEP